jgi:YbbR domain-containing protein
VQTSYDVPVSVKNLPPDLEVEEIQPPTVTVTFSGPRRAFYLFNAKRARVIVDATLADRGRRTFNISEEDVQHPPDVTVEEVKPSVIKLAVRKAKPNDSTQG